MIMAQQMTRSDGDSNIQTRHCRERVNSPSRFFLKALIGLVAHVLLFESPLSCRGSEAVSHVFIRSFIFIQ